MGFSPCGVAFGASRHCYTAPCRFFADGGQTHKIRWYRVSDDTPYYDGNTIFFPGLDDMFYASGAEYEKTGDKPNPRKHYSGRDIYLRPGVQADGDESDFSGESSKLKYPPNHQGIVEVCGPENIFAEIGFKTRRIKIVVPIERGRVAFELKAAAVDPPVVASHRALACGIRVLKVTPPVLSFGRGFALGAFVPAGNADLMLLLRGLRFGIARVADPIQLRPRGLALHAGVQAGVNLAASLGTGIALGAVVSDAESLALESGIAWRAPIVDPIPVFEAAFGLISFRTLGMAIAATIQTRNLHRLELGYHGVNPTPAGFTLNRGIECGIVRDDLSSPELPDHHALAFGAAPPAEAPTPPTPGSSCSSAGTMPMDLDCTYAISSGGQNWFSFAATAGQTYFVKVTQNSGSLGSTSVDTGSSCAFRTLQFFMFLYPGCNTFTPGSDTTAFISVLAGLMGDANYTIRVGHGGCP